MPPETEIPVIGPITSAEFDTTEDALRCLSCRVINLRKRRRIKCDNCGLWAHISCVGLTGRQADGLANWHCSRCMIQDLGTNDE